MTLGWVIYSLTTGAAAGVAARGAESALRGAGRPGRWAWVGALVLAVALSAAALRPAGRVATATPVGEGWQAAVDPGTATAPPGEPPQAATHADTPTGAGVPGAWARIRSSARGVLRRPVPEGAVLAGGVASGAALLLLLAGSAVTGLRARRWPVVSIDGTEVHVSFREGPAITGILRPRIVIPRRALALPPEELGAVLAHEEEHRRAGDVPLLAAALALVSIMPWNLPLWWLLARLRLAVEVDCDRRTVRRLRGLDTTGYGRLLLAQARSGHGPWLAAAALGRPARALETRIRLLLSPGSRRGGVVGGAVAALALVAACETPRPLAPVADESPAESAASWLRGPYEVRMPEDPYRIARGVWSGEGSGTVALRVRFDPDGSPRAAVRDAHTATATADMVEAAAAIVSVGMRLVSPNGVDAAAWLPVWVVFQRQGITATVVDPAVYDREGIAPGDDAGARLVELMETYRRLRGAPTGGFVDAGLDGLLREGEAQGAFLRGGLRGAPPLSVTRVSLPGGGS